MTFLVFVLLLSVAAAYPSIRSRIINGHFVDIEDFPHQVSILYHNATSYYQICGGSVISKDFVLTAAHCQVFNNISNYIVRYGSHFNYEGGTLTKVKQIFRHPKSKPNPYFFEYDIAIFQVTTPFVFCDKCQPIKLPKQNQEVEDGTILQVSGFGYQDADQKIMDGKLYALDLPFVNQEVCARIYYVVWTNITPNMICAGLRYGSTSPCSGDSGGPLIANGVQFGIVAASERCAGEFPTIFTNVAKFRDWIKEKTEV